MDFLRDLIEKLKAKQKEKARWWAAITWIVAGVYLFATTAAAHFFSVQGLLFFVLGTFVASAVFGSLLYVAQRSIVRLAGEIMNRPNRALEAFIVISGGALSLAQMTIVYLAARMVFDVLI